MSNGKRLLLTAMLVAMPLRVGMAQGVWSYAWAGDTVTVSNPVVFARVRLVVDMVDAGHVVADVPIVGNSATVTIANATANGTPVRDGFRHVLMCVGVWADGSTYPGFTNSYFGLGWVWPAGKPGLEAYAAGVMGGDSRRTRAFAGAIYDLSLAWKTDAPILATPSPHYAWQVFTNVVTTPNIALFAGTQQPPDAGTPQRIVIAAPNGNVRSTFIGAMGADSPTMGDGAVLPPAPNSGGAAHYRVSGDGTLDLDLASGAVTTAPGSFYDIWGPNYQDGANWVSINKFHADGPNAFLRSGAINLDMGGSWNPGPLCSDGATLAFYPLTPNPGGIHGYSVASGLKLWDMPVKSCSNILCSDGVAYAGVTVDNAPIAAAMVTAVATTGQITLSWASVAGATTYNIYRSTVAGGQGTVPYRTVTGTSFVDSGLVNGTTYFYVVTAVGTSEGLRSAEVSATPIVVVVTPGTAVFASIDAVAKGNWQGVYGADGYSISQSVARLPAYAAMVVAGNLNYVWSSGSPTTDVRSLQAPGGTRIASCWYSATTFSVDLNLTDGKTHSVAWYVMDWDPWGRSARIDVADTSGAVLDTRSIANYSGGQYMVWKMSGHVRLLFTNTGPQNTVLSGVFFDTPPSPALPPITGGGGTNPNLAVPTNPGGTPIPVAVDLLPAPGVVAAGAPAAPASYLTAIRMVDGGTVWRRGVSENPVAFGDGRLYCAAGSAITCYDVAGNQLWSRSGTYRGFGYASLSHTFVVGNGSRIEVLRGDNGGLVSSMIPTVMPDEARVGFGANRMLYGFGNSVYCWESPSVVIGGPAIPVNGPVP